MQKFVLCWLLIVSFVDSAKILAMLPFSLQSHRAVFEKYINGLYSRGHELTVVSPFPLRQNLPNYTFVNTAADVPNFTDTLMINGTITDGNLFRHFFFMNYFEVSHCHKILSHRDLRKLYTSEEKLFDLVILESYYVHCYLPLGAAKNVPIVVWLAPSRMFSSDLAIGNIQNPSYFPTLLRTFKFLMTKTASFFSRLLNFKNYVLNYLYYYFYFVPSTLSICREYFDGEVCNLSELFKSISLVLSYSHNVLHPRATVPNYVPIGGLHIEPVKPLPRDLQHFLDKSTEDVVFVSFGSLVKMSIAEEKIVTALLEAFSSCRCQILWRSDLDANSTRIPKNVLARKWFPQRDILAHKKIKAFVSHGGLYSTYEAIYTATPIVGVPLFFDQFDNIRRLEELGVGIYLSYEQISTHLKAAIKEILKKPQYRENMAILSKIVQDEQMTPLDRAVYWTEYVIRHNGAPYSRSSATDLPLYQYLLLDVFIVIVLLIILALYALQKIIRVGQTICRVISHKNKIEN